MDFVEAHKPIIFQPIRPAARLLDDFECLMIGICPACVSKQTLGKPWRIFTDLLVKIILPPQYVKYTDEEVERSYEEFYEDVHTEFLKFGELVNFKVCRNSSFHLRGNVYIQYKNLESAILAYNTMNGRYYAAKQITCEFVNITRWKIAICGEYMKSRLKTCSRGSACNFIHCFYNPGGDYEWSDWDNPPPRYWVKKMAVLFGPSDGPRQDMDLDLENQLPKELGKRRMRKSDRYHSRKDRYKEIGPSSSSGGDVSDGNGDRCRSKDRCSQPRRFYLRDRRKDKLILADDLKQSLGHCSSEIDHTDYSRYSYDSGHAMSKAEDRGSSHQEKRHKDRTEYSRYCYDSDDDMSKTKDRGSYHREKRHTERSCIEEPVRKHRSDSRSTEKIAVDWQEKSEKKSEHHGRRKRHHLLSSENSSYRAHDGSRKHGRSSDKAKNVSDVGEQYNDMHDSSDLYSEKEFPHKKKRSSDFSGSDGFIKETHEFPRFKYQCGHHKLDNETNCIGRQGSKGEDSSPVESLDDQKHVGMSWGPHDQAVLNGGSSRSHCRDGPASSGTSECSEDGSYEHQKRHFIVRRKRDRKKREHHYREENAEWSSDGVELQSGKSRKP